MDMTLTTDMDPINQCAAHDKRALQQQSHPLTCISSGRRRTWKQAENKHNIRQGDKLDSYMYHKAWSRLSIKMKQSTALMWRVAI